MIKNDIFWKIEFGGICYYSDLLDYGIYFMNQKIDVQSTYRHTDFRLIVDFEILDFLAKNHDGLHT